MLVRCCGRVNMCKSINYLYFLGIRQRSNSLHSALTLEVCNSSTLLEMLNGLKKEVQTYPIAESLILVPEFFDDTIDSDILFEGFRDLPQGEVST